MLLEIASVSLIWDKVPEEFKKWLEEQGKKTGQDLGLKLWEKFTFHQAEQDYREKLAKLYGFTRILGNSEPTPLEGIFTDLYILDKPLAMRRYSLDDLRASDEKLYGHNVQRCEGIEVVKQKNNDRLFILGKPGAGKTTFLKYITLQAVKGELLQTPIFVSLYDWSTSNKTLMEFIVEQFAICNLPKADSFIEYLLEKGKAILLLDGLDEVNNEHNQKVIKEVKNFCRKYDKTQCLITCRVASRDDSFIEVQFKYMEVADFTDAQIETFVKKWFAKEPIKCEKFLTEFKQEQYRGLRELASSPLLLGMLCLAFADSMEFTTRRVDIYEDAIDALLRKWDSSRSISRDVIYHGLNHQLKKRLFTNIAYKTFSTNQYLIEEPKLVADLTVCLKQLPNPNNQECDGEVVLKAIEAQHGIFIERAQKIHSFAHLTFQEYFAACAIKGNLNYQKELMKHITDPRWREVFLLTASLLDDADDFFDLFRNAIDNLIESDNQLMGLLNWTNKKALQNNSSYKKSVVRTFYISIDFDSRVACNIKKITKGVACDIFQVYLESESYIFNLTDNIAPAIISSIGLNLGLDLKVGSYDYPPNLRECSNAIELATKLINCKNMGRDYLMAIALRTILRFDDDFGESHKEEMDDGSFVICEYSYEDFVSENHRTTFNFFEDSIQQINKWGFTELAQQLIKLMPLFPSNNASRKQWHDFSIRLRHILQSQCDMGNQWSFTDTQMCLLFNYFDTNKLLLDCLKLATVSDREAIKNSLFLPPNQ